MNERQFRANLVGVIAIYALTILGGILLKIAFPAKDDPIYGTFKDLVPLAIATPAAWLGYCFQRRQAYLKDVKDLWTKLVSSVQKAIQYTHLGKAEQQAFAVVNESLSATTEELRAVFSNLGASQSNVGLFPFESLKAIQLSISRLGFGPNFSPEMAKTTRKEIVELWKKLRLHFLTELSRGVPAKPDSPYLKHDG